MNTLFRIAFGDYEFVLDRTSLTYSLTETVTKTVWGTGLSLGWIELKERETGAITRTDFGDCKLISIAEKMGAAGKRILLGLDAPGGVPVDIYVICGPKEIQLTVEASRDSKTHLLERVGLLPGLCHAEQGGYLVLPLGEGTLLYPERYLPIETPQYEWDRMDQLPVWESLTMPFLGAVQPESALALLTDSAYAVGELGKSAMGSVSASWTYRRDPERRRLDIRIVPIPAGDYVAIARAYREKLIAERNHMTLRKKIREAPEKEYLIGSSFIKVNTAGDSLEDFPAYLNILKTELGLDRALLNLVFNRYHEVPENLVVDAFSIAREQNYKTVFRPVGKDDELITVEESKARFGGEVAFLSMRWREYQSAPSRWNFIEQNMQELENLKQHAQLIVQPDRWEWLAIAADFTVDSWRDDRGIYRVLQNVPLISVIYRDSVVQFSGCNHIYVQLFLSALLRLNPPSFALPTGITEGAEEMIAALRPCAMILCILHALTFPAFLTSHTFLTPNFLVEEALYSDKTRVVINQSETESYETDDLLLPPGGFYVRHPQLEAHDALRVGAVEFPQRAWRVRRSLDGKPLEQSEQVEEREFEVT
ncbi:hypothetical protein [Armatimonas rosea]|uniref:Uncharacterized protein n=1 Tax=Armatimonas rosea TaxID=685828 RepID=A0A7W9W562_ARMRO|nr:hypothetical protein [Armatimonas rosea]MBB6048585.1 hypothetical protein [Armatimonas rosea]